MTCRTCIHFPIESVRDKAGRVRSDRGAKCLWEPPFPFPASSEIGGQKVAISLMFMRANDGGNCPCHVARIGEKKAQQ